MTDNQPVELSGLELLVTLTIYLIGIVVLAHTLGSYWAWFVAPMGLPSMHGGTVLGLVIFLKMSVGAIPLWRTEAMVHELPKPDDAFGKSIAWPMVFLGIGATLNWWASL